MLTKNQSPEEAEKNSIEEIRIKIAERVREDSRGSAKLTPVDFLGTLFSNQETGKVHDVLAEMMNVDEYKAIQSVVISTGDEFLYSDKYITRNYARILARVQTNDPLAIIAETVREESKIYPRPTNIELFRERLFNIDPNDLEAQITQLGERPEYNDIKLIHASTGARYLYSVLYMSEDHARSLVEWEEVGRYDNP
jgi:hypothetical protein